MTSDSQTQGRTKTAVVTGHHEYDVVALQTLFRGIPEVDTYPQNMEDFVTDTGGGRGGYEVLVFYNVHQPTPSAEQGELGARTKEALERIGETAQGILLLHHGIVAYPEWQLWSDLSGIGERGGISGHLEQSLRIEIASPQHPITSGLTAWDMVDESYVMADAGEGNEVLLTTQHPNSMRTIGWTRQYKKARVFCYQSGHDGQAFSNPQFRAVLARGVQWLAGRL